ncbi:hypothetical protein [Pseudarthrobacter raffinosi]|uniref:hypothetical protein n=1 Tax=Pseudarthrobacter raffinosi TaxID=2953651 RepID=UPI00208F2AB3|nr:hypothetical protein [Pseudarthrobacter sp. MDT3-9]MCO4250666.1 hypothetical protein [Pseudarthrobacter sp. MDT3-9]
MTLLLIQARRDRIVLPAWILGIAFLGFAIAGAVATEFADESERAAIIGMSVASPAFRFIRGLPDGTSIGALVFFQGYSFTAVLAGLMSTFLVIRHTRTDEELGRAELVGSVPVRRAASLTATLILGGAPIRPMSPAGGFRFFRLSDGGSVPGLSRPPIPHRC